MKIPIKKIIKYYDKGKYSHSELKEKKLCDTLDESLDFLENTKLNYVENKQGISAYEEVYFLVKEKSIFYKYTKAIDIDTKKEQIFKPNNFESEGNHEND